MISFIVPAHNEEALIVRTIQAIHHSARATGDEYEIIVVDDASTDQTAELARANGASVVTVAHRQIARTRNSGGHAARGDRLFFIDADTLAHPAAVQAALRVMDKGAVGGGALVKIEPPSPLYIRVLLLFALIPAKLAGFCGGAFMFCTCDAFLKSGGFDERMFWAEEGSFALRLKRLGRFTVIWQRVLTSGRRLQTVSGKQGWSFLRGLFRGSKAFTTRDSIKEIWYNSNRVHEQKTNVPISRRIANAILLFVTLSLITAPVWSFISWEHTPLPTAFGKFRFFNAMIICHAGLVFWPAGIALLVNLCRQSWSLEWVRLAAVTAFCLWQARSSSVGVMQLWMIIYSWVTTA
jgi:glycosyltransferase involved in cell wall biosynthesis